MDEILYASDRYFTVFDFLISHGQLLIRSSKSGEFGENIDIIFFNVNFQQLSTYCKRLTIRRASLPTTSVKSKAVADFLVGEENYLFEIESNNEKYYIAASFFKVYENRLEFHETSLGVIEYMGREIEIASSM